ncbi:MAG: L-2-amino-thiazoline-4-carboxylic acid hydrolase [Bradyrhizobium sp.]|nr:L-2-amino-thiazoline-4-carboxylic acid hydrolase [Bradyrhizobium sp.]
MVDTIEVAISHLQRRKIEGRALIPFIHAVRDKFGEKAAHEVVDETIGKLAPPPWRGLGFNSELELSRSQTIMEGATSCDFRFRKRP